MEMRGKGESRHESPTKGRAEQGTVKTQPKNGALTVSLHRSKRPERGGERTEDTQ